MARPRGFYQSLILGAFGVIAAFCTAYAYEYHVAGGLSIWVAVMASLFFFATSALQIFLIPKASYRTGFLLLETVAILLPFLGLGLEILIIGGIMAFLFLLWGYLESRSELKYGTEIRFFKATHAVTAKLTTILLLLGIFFFVMLRGNGGSFFMSEDSFGSFFRGGAALFADFYPGVSVNGSFQEFAESVAQEQLAAMPTFQTLTPGEQATATEQTAAALTTNFSRALGVPISASSTTSGVIYNFIVSSLAHWHDRFGAWFVVAWALALFLVLRSFGVVFIMIAQFFSMIFYEILLATGMIQVVEHPQTKEEIEFT